MNEPTQEVPPSHSYLLGQRLSATRYLEERERAQEALMLSLSDDGLSSILKALRQFREGKPLLPKVRKILEGVLREANHQEFITKARRKLAREREGGADA